MAKRTAAADPTVRDQPVAVAHAASTAKPPKVVPRRRGTDPQLAGEVRGSLRDEQRAVTRRRLMSGALEVFDKSGYTASTVDEIAAAAGVSRATFYLHFRGKLDLVGALIGDRLPEIESYYERLDAVFDSGDRTDVEAWVRDAMAYFDRNRTLTFVIGEVLATEREKARDMGADVPFTEFMPSLVARWPVDRRAEAAARVRLMVWMLERAWMLWKSGGLMSEEDEDMMVRILADVWLNTVSEPGPPR